MAVKVDEVKYVGGTEHIAERWTQKVFCGDAVERTREKKDILGVNIGQFCPKFESLGDTNPEGRANDKLHLVLCSVSCRFCSVCVPTQIDMVVKKKTTKVQAVVLDEDKLQQLMGKRTEL